METKIPAKESLPETSLRNELAPEVTVHQETRFGKVCSPRSILAFSFLSVLDEIKNKIRFVLSQHAQSEVRTFAPSSGKNKQSKERVVVMVLSALLLIGGGGLALAHNTNSFVPKYQEFPDPEGRFANLNIGGPTDLAKNAFFQDLGTNGRRCVTCHQPNDAWTVTPRHILDRFNATNGTDPIFRTNDGAGCPTQDVSTVEARREAYSLLLNKGLIRIEQQVPVNAEFTVLNSDNPYGCNSTSAISAYRRPLPTTNIPYLSTIMWDGRETLKNPDGAFQPISNDLSKQASDATIIHAQGHELTAEQTQQILNFETQIFTAQTHDDHAGDLDDDGAKGGPEHLSKENFFIGINDPLGLNPTGAAFTNKIFDLYRKWNQIEDRGYDEHTEARRSVARGEHLFNTLRIPITGVGGLNDALNQPVINGFCGTCHDTPNVGDHSVPAPLNIGVVDAERRTPDLPLVTVICNATGQITQVSDLGRAMVTGKCADIGKFKGPILRGLAARAPYFHNGFAASLDDVIDFYNTRFNLNLSQRDKEDLIAFLKTL
jgi:cytochrome c peroxidase